MTHTSINFSELETVSLTAELTKETNKWQHYKKNPALGSFGARTVGFIATPVTCLIDSIVHAFLFVGKATTGLFVSFYNHAIAKHINPKYMAPRDLEISSAVIHLVRIIENVFRAAIMPVLMLLSPDRGYLLSQEPSGGNVKALLGTLVANQTKIKSLEKQHKALKAACQSEKAEKADLIKDYKKASDLAEDEINALYQQIDELKDTNKELLKDMSALTGKHAKAIEAKVEELSEQADEMSALGHINTELKKTIHKIEGQIALKEEELKNALSGDVDAASLLQDKKQLETELDAVQDKLDAANAKLVVTEEEFQEEHQKHLALAGVVGKLEGDLKDIEEAKEKLEEQLIKDAQVITLASKDVSAKESELKELQKQHAFACKAHDKVLKEHESAWKTSDLKIAELNGQVKFLDEALVKVGVQKADVEKQLAEGSKLSGKQIAELKGEIVKLEDQGKDLKAQLEKASQQHAKQTEQLKKNAQAELGNKESEIAVLKKNIEEQQQLILKKEKELEQANELLTGMSVHSTEEHKATANMQQQIHVLQQDHKKLSDELQLKRIQMEAVEGNNKLLKTELNEQKEKLNGQIEELNKEHSKVVENLEEINNQVMDKLKAANASEKEVAEHLELKEQQVTKLKEAVQKLNLSLKEAKEQAEQQAEHSSKIVLETGADLQKASDAQKQLQSKLSAQAAELQLKKEELEGAYGELETAQKAAAATLMKTQEEAAAKASFLEEQIKDLAGQLEVAKEEYNKVDIQLNELKVEKQDWIEGKQKLEEEVQVLRADLEQKEASLESRQALLSKLQVSVGEFEEQAVTLKSQGEEMSKLNSDLLEEVKVLKDEVQELKEQLSSKEDELDLMEGQLLETTSENEKLADANKELKAEVKELKSTAPKQGTLITTDLLGEALKEVKMPPKKVGFSEEKKSEVVDIPPFITTGQTAIVSSAAGELLEKIEIDFIALEKSASKESSWNSHISKYLEHFENAEEFKIQHEKVVQWLTAGDDLDNIEMNALYNNLEAVISTFNNKV